MKCPWGALDGGFGLVEGGAVGLVEDAEVAGEFGFGQGVGGFFVGGVVGRGDGLEATAFAFDRTVERAGVKLDALGEAFDHREAVVGCCLLLHGRPTMTPCLPHSPCSRSQVKAFVYP